MKQKRFRWEPKNSYLKSMMRSIVGIMLINFIFQGFLGMSKGEKAFKIFFELIGFSLCYVSLTRFFDVGPLCSFTFALLFAHSLNWTLNGQFWVAFRYCDKLNFKEQKLKNFIAKTQDQIGNRDYIRGALIIGSFTERSADFKHSDIDLRLIKSGGLLNGWKANLYNSHLKMKAFFQKIPLDVYLYDDLAPLKKFKAEEIPLLLKDADDFLKKFYDDRAGYQIFQPPLPAMHTVAKCAVV